MISSHFGVNLIIATYIQRVLINLIWVLGSDYQKQLVMTHNRSVKWRKNWAYLLIAELSSSRRRASVVEVLSSLDRLSILFRITSSMSLIFLSTPRDSTPPSTEWRDTYKENKNLEFEAHYQLVEQHAH